MWTEHVVGISFIRDIDLNYVVKKRELYFFRRRVCPDLPPPSLQIKVSLTNYIYNINIYDTSFI
jgi:hypothetical protein